MRKFLMTIVIMAAAVGLIAMASIANRSDAMPLGDPSGIRAALDDLNMIDKVQYYWGVEDTVGMTMVGTGQVGTGAAATLFPELAGAAATVGMAGA